MAANRLKLVVITLALIMPFAHAASPVAHSSSPDDKTICYSVAQCSALVDGLYSDFDAGGRRPSQSGRPSIEEVVRCTSFEACLELLVANRSYNAVGIGSTAHAVIANFRARFGEEMRLALLEQALNGDDAWTNYASFLLANWGGWRHEDLPKLERILSIDRGGWIARAIGEVGGPDAIAILMKDVAIGAVTQNPTTGALKTFPASEVLKRVLTVFEIENKKGRRPEHDAMSWAGSFLVQERKATAISEFGEKWQRIALSNDEPVEKRRTALQALAAIGPQGHLFAPRLRKLSSRPDMLGEEARRVLKALTDETVVRSAFEECMAVEGAQEYPDIVAAHCIGEVASYQARGVGALELVLPYTRSPRTDTRIETYLALVSFGDISVADHIAPGLQSNDWEEVLVALQALVELDALSYRDDIGLISAKHWWPEVRRLAKQQLALIGKQKFDRDPTAPPIKTRLQYRVERGPVLPDMLCTFEGKTFSFVEPLPWRREIEFPVGGGVLRGVNRGEFGGKISFETFGKEASVELQSANPLMFHEAGTTIVSVTGLSHLGLSSGALFNLTRSRNEWQSRLIGRLPAEPTHVAQINSEHFAALSAGWAVVYSADEILGTAECQ